MSYKIFTVSSGQVSEGAEVSTLVLKGANISIPAIIIGEEGRGRQRGVVPVANPPQVPCPDRGKELWSSRSDTCSRCGAMLGELKGDRRLHPDTGLIQGCLQFAEVSTTKAGKPKLFSQSEATTDEKIVVVFRTKMGFRGGNSHTGDRAGWKCSNFGCNEKGQGNVPETCPKCGAVPNLIFSPFPGEIITRGCIAEGIAGRMGSGEQLVAIIPKGVVFRTSYSGRLYGSPGSHYYLWDGERLIAATWTERSAADLF